MSVDDTIKEILNYKSLAGKIKNVDQWLCWTGAAYLSRFVHNIKTISEQDMNFAELAAEHKLEQLRNYEQNWENSATPTGDFMDVYLGIYNIGLLDGRKIIRCSQPSIADLNWLVDKIRIKVVLNLRSEDQYWEGYTKQNEDDVCIENMIEHVNIPMEDWDDPPPARDLVDTALAKIDYHMKPVLIHCAEGKGRMSIVAAAYRLSRQGWDWEKTMEEALDYGFDPNLNPNQVELMKSYISG